MGCPIDRSSSMIDRCQRLSVTSSPCFHLLVSALHGSQVAINSSNLCGAASYSDPVRSCDWLKPVLRRCYRPWFSMASMAFPADANDSSISFTKRDSQGKIHKVEPSSTRELVRTLFPLMQAKESVLFNFTRVARCRVTSLAWGDGSADVLLMLGDGSMPKTRMCFDCKNQILNCAVHALRNYC